MVLKPRSILIGGCSKQDPLILLKTPSNFQVRLLCVPCTSSVLFWSVGRSIAVHTMNSWTPRITIVSKRDWGYASRWKKQTEPKNHKRSKLHACIEFRSIWLQAANKKNNILFVILPVILFFLGAYCMLFERVANKAIQFSKQMKLAPSLHFPGSPSSITYDSCTSSHRPGNTQSWPPP